LLGVLQPLGGLAETLAEETMPLGEVTPFEAKPSAAEAEPPEPAPTKKPSCQPPDSHDSLTGVLQRIQVLRRRPLFALVSDHITDETYEEVYRWKDDLPEELDILIDSPGGVLDSCYRVARAIGRRANSWDALVPTVAASGATLVCLGSTKLVMADAAQMSPIDPQVLSKRREKFFDTERQSPIEAFQAVKYVRTVALTSLDTTMVFLREHHVAAKPALDTACIFASNVAEALLGKIDPYDLGAFALDSAVSMNYCERIATPPDLAKKTQRNAKFKLLVERYPAHEFVIDREEAATLGFSVSAPSPELDKLFDEAREVLKDTSSYIGMVPSK